MSRPEKERKLIESCRRGDRKAQRELYDRFASRMLVVCERYMGSKEAAEDVLQEGFLTVYTKLGLYSGKGSFEGWIRKVMVNTALCELRKNDVMNGVRDIDSTFTPDIGFTDVLENLEAKDLLKLVMSMPESYRAVFNLAVFEGMPHAQIAKELGITEANSRSQLSRGKTWLKERIKKMKLSNGRF